MRSRRSLLRKSDNLSDSRLSPAPRGEARWMATNSISEGWSDMDASLPDLRRRLQEETRRREAAERERDEFAGFALAGQAAAGLAHELNNLLNTIVLQSSVLQLQVDEKFHSALDVIRRQANASTGLLRILAQVSGERAKSFYPVDLNRAVQEVLAEQAALAAQVQWVPTERPLLCVRGIYSAIKQTIRLLLKAASGGESSPLRLRTTGEDHGVQLVVESEEKSGGAGRLRVPMEPTR